MVSGYIVEVEENLSDYVNGLGEVAPQDFRVPAKRRENHKVSVGVGGIRPRRR